MGERVLAVARYRLEPEIYSNDYQFDVKTWKAWKDERVRNAQYPGWFPMFGLTLVGLISLNDPPRIGVDRSVLLCKEAGVKVIMVTGDQPPTAGAIAHKVNIIRIFLLGSSSSFRSPLFVSPIIVHLHV